jgi:diaminopimelate decarboxylase
MKKLSEDFIKNAFLLDLAETYGTPVYVYDGEKIIEQIRKLKTAFSGLNFKIMYAAKALTNLSILKLIKKENCGIDVVSIQELRLAILAGYPLRDIMFTPNNTPFAEIEQAVDIGVQINLDNLPFLENFGKRYGNTIPVCIRINPHIDAGGNEKIKTGHAESKFGISYLQKNEILNIVRKYNLYVNGLHFHTGSDFGDVDIFIRSARILFDVAKDYHDLQFLDFGSGFKVPYKKGDKETNLSEFSEKIGEEFYSFCKNYGKNLEIWFEPGKYIVSESGLLLVSCTVIKETPSVTFIGVNSGLNHLIRPMMYNAHHDIINLSNPTGKLKKYCVSGYICETDNFAWNQYISETKEGDILAIKNAGAYGYSMSSNYNSRFRPPEVLIYNQKNFLIRRRETLSDLLATQIVHDI